MNQGHNKIKTVERSRATATEPRRDAATQSCTAEQTDLRSALTCSNHSTAALEAAQDASSCSLQVVMMNQDTPVMHVYIFIPKVATPACLKKKNFVINGAILPTTPHGTACNGLLKILQNKVMPTLHNV